VRPPAGPRRLPGHRRGGAAADPRDIPRLSRSNFNEAKRFVTLIDALYEARVRLIASAAARPEMLYVEGEGAFEFERTASRLREMQAADWGSREMAKYIGAALAAIWAIATF
jgi:hypothetical protein